jgi:hypothetical protein
MASNPVVPIQLKKLQAASERKKERKKGRGTGNFEGA